MHILHDLRVFTKELYSRSLGAAADEPVEGAGFGDVEKVDEGGVNGEAGRPGGADEEEAGGEGGGEEGIEGGGGEISGRAGGEGGEEGF